MFRLRCAKSFLRRLLHVGTVNRDQVLEQLQVCSAEDRVFDVVGKNKAKLHVNHVSKAVEMLWHIQKEKPQMLRNTELIKRHPQFLTLRVLAENKIALMDDLMLVDMLYSLLRLQVDPRDSLVQQLISEAWLRVDGFSARALSKFSICLNDQQHYHSPLMGHITRIVDQRLSSIDDIRNLATLMICVSHLASPRLRDAMINRAIHLLDTTEPLNDNVPRRLLQFLRNVKYSYWPLMEKCNKIILYNISSMDAGNISIIIGLYQALQFNNCDFWLAVKPRLMELIDLSTDPFSFTKLFVSLAPMASPEIREGLENTALLLADEFTENQALAILAVLEEIHSRNLSLLNKITSVIHKNLDTYKSMEVAKIAQALFLLRYQKPELLAEIRAILVNFLQRSIFPTEVTNLTRVLSMLPCPRIDEVVISRVKAVVAQCSFSDLNTISFAITKWMHKDPYYHHDTSSRYIPLLQTLNRYGHERLQTADRLDLLLEEFRYISGECYDETLLEGMVVTLKRMMDQINSNSVPELGLFLTRINHLCPPLMDRMASVTIEDIDKIHYTAIYTNLLPFSVLNYYPVQADELYDVCVRHIIPHISSFNPHMLVLMAYTLALANCYPEELVREIFTMDFLRKLDAQLETQHTALNLRTRMRLMELNRAVCLECPEFMVPWFHDRYCHELQKRGHVRVGPVHQQIHKMLGEVLGGINCVQAAVVTPYFYTIDFECILDKHMQALPYSEPSKLQISDRGKVYWQASSAEGIKDELPPGAQRVAVDFLDAKAFCRNCHHMKGETLMRKRHLEILGYRVVQIPHFEWNSMELSTQDAWKEYLRKRLFGELPS